MKMKKLTIDERMHLFISKSNAHRQDYEYPLTVETLKSQKWFARIESILDNWGVPNFAK